MNTSDDAPATLPPPCLSEPATLPRTIAYRRSLRVSRTRRAAAAMPPPAHPAQPRLVARRDGGPAVRQRWRARRPAVRSALQRGVTSATVARASGARSVCRPTGSSAR